MYVFMYVCMYVRMYVCMYVCTCESCFYREHSVIVTLCHSPQLKYILRVNFEMLLK